MLADVRKLPGSNKYPHCNRDELSVSLAGAGIRYVYLEGLGGRRRPHKDSKNVAWRNKSFRAYADHMETAEYREGVAALLAHARQSRTAIMCAEAVWWRCHRALIADYLKTVGVAVYHIMGAGTNKPHPYTSDRKQSKSRRPASRFQFLPHNPAPRLVREAKPVLMASIRAGRA